MINIRYLNSDLIITVKIIRFVSFRFSFVFFSLYFSQKDEKEKRWPRKKTSNKHETRKTKINVYNVAN